MESGSRSSRGFDEEDEDEEGTSKKVEFTVTADRGNDQRSKHSAMEQRRRSKINERFQMLRELIPHGDQKRDRASFLLEVVEYIRFLQEKVQKYESSYPVWNEENAKSMPWVKVYFRSLWKDALNNNQVPVDGTADPSHTIRTGPAQGLVYSVDEDRVPNIQNPIETDTSAHVPNKAMENLVDFTNNTPSAPICSQPNYASVERVAGVTEPQPRLISDIDNMASQSQAQWLRPSCAADYNVSSDTLGEQDELAIDDGTINISTAYSQNILNALNQALESSGIDLSQSNVSVQIKLGRRATRRETATTMSSAKDQDVREPGRARKRSKAGKS